MFPILISLIFAGLNIIWSFIFLFFDIFNIKLYKIQGEKNKLIYSSVYLSSLRSEYNEPLSWIVGKYYIGYFYKNKEFPFYDLYLLCHKSFYDKKFICTDNTNSENKTITLYECYGNYFCINYNNRSLAITTLKPKIYQQNIITKMLKIYEEKNYGRFFISSKPGRGKSLISLLLCKTLLNTCETVSLIDTFNPTEPGNNFYELYNKIKPTKTSPLIIIFEEIDIMITKIHNETICRNKNISTQIVDKTTQNQFLDRFDRNLYDGVIIIMTSNKELSYFNNLDSSYFRKGRVDIKFKIN